MNEREYLLIRGRLSRADDFEPRRCSSTRHVKEWPEPVQPDHGDVVVQTVADDGSVLRAEQAAVIPEAVCAPGEPTWRVRAYVPLDDHATEVQLRRSHGVLWRAAIPERPNVDVALISRPGRGDRTTSKRRGRGRATPGYPGGEPAVVEIEYTEPADRGLAFIKVVHRWGDRQWQVVHIGRPARRVTIDPDRLPGGKECELLVVYSNGYRSASARTDVFSLDPIGPVITISRPAPGAVFTTGTPIDLEGSVVDPEQPARPLDPATAVWSIDGEVIGTGLVASVGPLPQGRHRIELAYRSDDRGRDELPSVGVDVEVRQSDVPNADDWEPFDHFAE
jgi:hypothetical protein